MTLRRALSANIVFLTLLVLVIAVICAGTAYVLNRQRDAATSEAISKTVLQTKAFEEHLTRNLENVQHLADSIAADIFFGQTETIQQRLQYTLRQAPFIRSLSILDSSNTVVFSSNPENVGKLIDTQDFFPQETPSHPAEFRIGQAWIGRDFNEGKPREPNTIVLSTDLKFIPLLFRSNSKSNDKHIVATLNPDFFINYFTQWLSQEDGYVELLRYDRLVLFNSDLHPGSWRVSSAQTLSRIFQQSEIGYFHEKLDDAPGSFTAFRASRIFPLIIVTHAYEDRALAPSRNEQHRLLLLVGIALFSLTALAVTVYRREVRIAAKEEATRRQEYERLAATVFETVLEAVMVSDANNRIITVNPAFSRITGYLPHEAIGENFSLLATGYKNDEFFDQFQNSLSSQGKWEGEVRCRRKSGEIFVAWLSINQVRNDEGLISYLVTGFSDITEYYAEAERISHLAHHDLLTGLPNRVLLLDRLKQGLHQASRNSLKLAVLFFDLDKFKAVNDTLGHTFGDRLLQTIAENVSSVVRAADTFARLGGDEFVVLLPMIGNEQDAIIVAEKIRQVVSQPIQLDQHTIHISAAIGIAFFPENATTDNEMLKRADAAMYQAKIKGGNRCETYQTDIGR